MRPLIYERTFWESHIVTNPDLFEFNGVTSQLIPQFGPVIQQGTERNPSNFNNMEEGIVAAINAANNHARDIILIQIALLKENIVFSPSKVKFAAVPDVVWTESIGQIDFTKGYADTVNTGTDNVDITNMNVGSFSGFKVGQEITMQDDANGNKENLIIQSLADPNIQFTTNIIGTYAGGANIYRSNVIEDSGKFKFGNFGFIKGIDYSTPESVVSGAGNTMQDDTTLTGRSAGQKILDINGELFAFVRNPAGQVTIFKDILDGNGFVLFATDEITTDWAAATDGSYIYLARFHSLSIDVSIYDLTGTMISNTQVATQNQNLWNGSIAISPNGVDIIITWAGTDLNNWDNLYNVKGTILNGVVTWSGRENISNQASSWGGRFNPPPVTYKNDGYPIIAVGNWTGTTDTLRVRAYNGSSWSNLTVYSQSNNDPFAEDIIYIPPEVATLVNPAWTVGLLVLSFGADDGDIYTAYSTDDGASWNSQEVIAGTYRDSRLTYNNVTGRIYLAYRNTSGSIFEHHSDDGGATWSTQATRHTNAAQLSYAHNINDFNSPIMIYDNDSNNEVFVSGNFEVGTEVPVKEVDVRLNIEPPEEFQRIVSWLNYDDEPTFTADALASIVGQADPESYFDMEDITTDLGATDEVVSGGIGPNLGDKITLKYNLTRGSINDEVLMNYFLGYLVL